MINPAEQKDLDEMKKARAEAQTFFYQLSASYADMTVAELENCGFKTHKDAVWYSFENCRKKIKSLEAAYLKKWPD